MKQLLLIITLLLFITSCSVQKRRYQKGYFVSHQSKNAERSFHRNTEIKQTKKSIVKKDSAQVVYTNPITTTEANALKHQDHFSKKNKSKLFLSEPDSCDLIVFKDGSEIRAIVDEVGIEEVKYKRCDSKNGPMYVTRKSDIFMIKYINGSKDIMKTEVAPAEQKSEIPLYVQKPYRPKQTHPYSLASLAISILGIMFAIGISIYQVAAPIGTAVVIPLGVYFFWFLICLVAAIFGIVAIFKIREERNKYKGFGQAITGMIIGSIFALVAFIVLLENL